MHYRFNPATRVHAGRRCPASGPSVPAPRTALVHLACDGRGDSIAGPGVADGLVIRIDTACELPYLHGNGLAIFAQVQRDRPLPRRDIPSILEVSAG